MRISDWSSDVCSSDLPSRLVNTASGWMDVPDSGSDVYDIHTYDEVPVAPSAHPDRPIVTGEYGGVGLPIQGHLWFNDRAARLYQFATEKAEYRKRYQVKVDQIVRPAQSSEESRVGKECVRPGRLRRAAVH